MLEAASVTRPAARHDLTIRTCAERGVRVVSVVGEADLATEQWLLPGLRRAVSPLPAALVLDLSGLSFCSARSIWGLADWAASAAHRRVLLAAVGLSAQLSRLWLMTDLPIPTQYATVDRAVAALGSRLDRRFDPAWTADPDTVTVAVLEQEILGLRRAMETRATIEQAKGVMMAVFGCTAEEAFDVLARRSQHANRKLTRIAAKVLEDAHHNRSAKVAVPRPATPIRS